MRSAKNSRLPVVGGLSVCGVMMASTPVLAQQQADGLSAQTFAPAADRREAYIASSHASVGSRGTWGFGLLTHYAHNPLVLVNDADEVERRVVGAQLTGDLVGSYAITDWFEVGLAIPLFLYQTGEAVDALPAAEATDPPFRLGDIRLSVRGEIIQAPEVGAAGPVLGAGLWASFPTGNEETYQGGEWNVEPRVMFDWVFASRARVGAGVGYRIGPEQTLANIERNDALNVTGAGFIPVGSKDIWGVALELQSALAMGADGVERVNSPVEMRAGARAQLTDLALLEFGAGTGIVAGAGSPDFRVYAGASFGTPEDPDGDGLVGSADTCPRDPEDFDGFEDEDGCSDPDNDGDGILDGDDGLDRSCDGDPEDMDGFEDNDGCPDPDNDGDGVLDVDDMCPMEPEDADGFEDADGCPDPDNDGDTVPDTEDSCPLEPEDMDAFMDADGCPDPDNDEDGILDMQDGVDGACMNDPEDLDGFEDTDGCPEEGQGLVAVTCEAITIADSVYFATNSDVIEERSFELLNQVVSVLNQAQYIRRMRVEGHTDDRGSDVTNLDLSQRRAASVVRYLTENGVDPSRLESEGYGESRPIADNRTAAGRQTNRRVVFVIVEQDSNCAAE